MTVEEARDFVVFTTNRSGSEWVMSTLNSFEGVRTQGELFLDRPHSAEKQWDSDFAHTRYIESRPRGLPFRPFKVWSYLKELYAQPGKVGFKLMYKQLGAYPEILPYLMARRVKVVHLVRRNHLDVMLSYAVKARIGHAHLMEGQQAPDELRVELDTSSLVRKMAWLQRQQDMARSLLRLTGLSHLEAAYEDLVRDPSLYQRIGDFLSIETVEQAPRSALTRIRRGSHRDVIGNYDQVRSALANSEFAGLLE